MACPSSSKKYMGRIAIVEYSLKDDPQESDWLRLGSTRSKEWGAEWNTSDSTTDDSPENTSEEIVTTKGSTVSFDGVATRDAGKNLDTLEDYVNDPTLGGTECNEPWAWLRITVPRDGNLKQYTGPVLFTSFRNTAPHDDVATWSLEGSSYAYNIAYIDEGSETDPGVDEDEADAADSSTSNAA